MVGIEEKINSSWVLKVVVRFLDTKLLLLFFISVLVIGFFCLPALHGYPTDWSNIYMAKYYGLSSIKLADAQS